MKSSDGSYDIAFLYKFQYPLMIRSIVINNLIISHYQIAVSFNVNSRYYLTNILSKTESILM